MTANDYIQQKFQTFGIQLSEADLLDIVEDAGLENGDVERDASNKVRVSVAMAKFIPSLLLRPVSMGEGEFQSLGILTESNPIISFCANNMD